MADGPRKKVTKRTDRGSKLERSVNVLSSVDTSEDLLGKGEPFHCTGRFSDDFPNVCRQAQLSYFPPVIQRNKRAPTPPIVDVKVEKTRGKRTAMSNNESSQSLVHSDGNLTNNPSSHNLKQTSFYTSNESDENRDHDHDSMPKTFLIAANPFEYFKPKIQIEVDPTDSKHEAVTEIHIHGWRLEMPIINVLQQCLPVCDRLVTLDLWNSGLTAETLDALAKILPNCASIKNLVLDGNPVLQENYNTFIADENTKLQSLSLRNCQITDMGAGLIGSALGTIKRQNNKLISLNMSGNMITDFGAVAIANGLRVNRTLLVLNLAGNQIGDIGAMKIAESLSRFKMAHDEILHRRMVKKERSLKDHSPAFKKQKGDSDRPTSLHTASKEKTFKEIAKNVKKEKGEKGEKGEKENGEKNKTEKADASSTTIGKEKTPKAKDSQTGRDPSMEKANTTLKGKNKDKEKEKEQGKEKEKEKDKEKDKENTLSASLAKRDKENRPKDTISISSGDNKTVKSSKTKTSKKNKDQDGDHDSTLRSASGTKLSATNALLLPEYEPLLDEAEAIDGDLWLTGNRVLISLNLSRNLLTPKAVTSFVLCIQYQATLSLLNKNVAQGLLKLNLNNNEGVPYDNEQLLKLNELMKARDPILNRAMENTFDNLSLPSKDGRETSRSKTNSKF